MGTLEDARKLFANDTYASSTTGVEIDEIGEDYAKCSLVIKDIHRNIYNSVMGGAIYTLADLAFAVASNFNKDVATVSIGGQSSFMASTKGSVLYAEAKLIKDGRSNCFYEVLVTDDLGKKIAFFSFVGAHLEKR